MRRLACLAFVLAAGAMIGCGPKVPQSSELSLVVQETTGLHPIRMTVNADGENIFGPLATLKPGETKTFELNDPPEHKQLLGQHTVLYTFDRVGPLGTVGQATIKAKRDGNVVFEDDSRKVLTGFAPTYSFRYTITPPAD